MKMSKRNPFDKKREVLRNLLIQIRKDNNITQTELSKKLEKPQSFVSKYENGERNLDVIEIYQICLALNTSFIGVMQDFQSHIDKKYTLS
jgi:transcriptional regulator with XRE-family HTH domain